MIGIAGHVSRESMALELKDRVQADVLNVDSTRGDHIESVIACANNHLTVLERLHAACDDEWAIVLEDDALPVDDFRVHASEALRNAPEPAVGFYIGRVTATERNERSRQLALDSGVAWLRANHLISAVAYAISPEVLTDVIRFYRTLPPEATVEARLTQWATNRRSGGTWPRFAYTVPAIVDHSDCDSIIFENADTPMRRAWRVGVPPNWATPVMDYD